MVKDEKILLKGEFEQFECKKNTAQIAKKNKIITIIIIISFSLFILACSVLDYAIITLAMILAIILLIFCFVFSNSNQQIVIYGKKIDDRIRLFNTQEIVLTSKNVYGKLNILPNNFNLTTNVAINNYQQNKMLANDFAKLNEIKDVVLPLKQISAISVEKEPIITIIGTQKFIDKINDIYFSDRPNEISCLEIATSSGNIKVYGLKNSEEMKEQLLELIGEYDK